MAITNLIDFRKDLERFDDAMNEEISDSVYAISKEALEKLAEMSPVLTGTYIYNHRLSSTGSSLSVMYFPHTPGETHPENRASKKATLGAEMVMRELLTLIGVKNSGKIIINNNVPYADAIELGSSNYAPAGVYRIVSAHLETIAEQLIAVLPKHTL